MGIGREIREIDVCDRPVYRRTIFLSNGTKTCCVEVALVRASMQNKTNSNRYPSPIV